MTLARSAAGLLLREAFDAANGWTAGTGWSRVSTPALVHFWRHPTAVMTGSGAEVEGVREPQLYVESSGLWVLIYDAGDGATGWRIFVATSADRGLTWTKHGALGPALSNGSGGSVAASATGWLEKRGSTYYLHRVIAAGTFASPNIGLPAAPYTGDTWTTTTAPGAGWATGANWTFVRAWGPGTGWASLELLPCSVFFDGTTYHMTAEGGTGVGYESGRQYSSSPTGPWTLDTSSASRITRTSFEMRYPENGKTFQHPTLGYVQLLNLIAVAADVTDRNAVVIGESLTDWSVATYLMTQRLYSPSVTTTGQHAVGVQCHITGPDGALVHEDGFVPFIFDTDPTASSGAGWHRHRSLRSAVYEPAAYALHYADGGATRHRYSRSLSHTDFEVEFSVAFATVGGGGDISFEYRSNGTTGYRLRFPATYGSNVLLERMDGTLIDSGALGIAGAEALVLMAVKLRVQTAGGNTTHTAWVDGSQNFSVVDNTYASGTEIAFSGKTQTGDVRLLSVRSGPTLTVRGLGAGATVTVRSHGELPVATITADGSGVATYTADHWPLSRIEIDGTDQQTSDRLLWGGDDLNVSSEVSGDAALGGLDAAGGLVGSAPVSTLRLAGTASGMPVF